VTVDEERAFEAFVRADGDRLLRLARLLFLDDRAAEDAVQTALMRTARRWRSASSAPYAYVRVVLVNLARDGGRRRHLVQRPVEVRDTDIAPVADHADAVAARAELDALLAQLPAKQRATVVLRVIDGLSEAETAQALQCSAGTVKSNLSRGLARLRELMAADREVTCRD
jgi:RNA polymerase sigma-70 factor (sigma-E family)